MATTKPRITLSLQPRLYEVIRTISGATGQPMSGIISELLETSVPVLERLAATTQRFKAVKDDERATLLAALADAEATLAPVAQGVLGQFDLFLEQAVAFASKPQQSRSDSSAAGAPQTPRTNRGVTPTRRKPRKPSNGKASRAISPSVVSTKKRG